MTSIPDPRISALATALQLAENSEFPPSAYIFEDSYYEAFAAALLEHLPNSGYDIFPIGGLPELKEPTE